MERGKNIVTISVGKKATEKQQCKGRKQQKEYEFDIGKITGKDNHVNMSQRGMIILGGHREYMAHAEMTVANSVVKLYTSGYLIT